MFISQVKRYIDLYSATSVIGLPSEDLNHLTQLYTRAQANWSNLVESSCLTENEIADQDHDSRVSILQKQIDAYSSFLESVAKLARSAWTEFDLILMGVGLIVMFASIFVHFFALRRVNVLSELYYPLSGTSGISSRLIYAHFLAIIRGASFLSNSYICESNISNFLKS